MASNHIKIINLVDEIKEQIPEGIYLQLCNELKKNYEIDRPDKRNELINENLNLQRRLGRERLEVSKLHRENVRLEEQKSRLWKENMKYHQEKIEKIDWSACKTWSDTGLDTDDSSDDSSDFEEKVKELLGE